MTRGENAAIGIGLSLFAWPFLAILNAFTIRTLWGWFIVPNFDAPPLSWHAALGLSLLVGYLTVKRTEPKADQDYVKDAGQAIAFGVINPILTLAFGWVYHALTRNTP